MRKSGVKSNSKPSVADFLRGIPGHGHGTVRATSTPACVRAQRVPKGWVKRV